MVNVGLRREMYETEVEYKRGGGRKLEGQIKKKEEEGPDGLMKKEIKKG